MPILFLPVESTPRELDYKLNIARLFCHDGFDVMIGNPPFLRDELKYKNYTGIFLEKGVNPIPEYYSLLVLKCIRIFDLGDEGASNPVYSLGYQKAIDSLKSMTQIFLWGKTQQDRLIELYSGEDVCSKYKVLGNPGFDLCLPKFRRYNQFFNPIKRTGYILINTNFGLVNSYSIEEQIQACDTISPQTFAFFETYRKH